MLYALKDCANLRIQKSTTKEVVLYVDYAKTSSIEFTSDSVFAMRKNTKAVRFDSNREGTFTTSMEVFPMDIIPLLFGTEFKADNLDWAKRYVGKVTSGVVTLPKGDAPIVGSVSVYKLADDKLTHDGDALKASSETNPDAGNFSSSSTGTGTTAVTTLKFHSSMEGAYVTVYYMINQPSKSFTINSTDFPKGYVIYGDTSLRGTDQNDKYVQFELLNVKPQSGASLTMDVDNICTLEITWDIMSDGEGNMLVWKSID